MASPQDTNVNIIQINWRGQDWTIQASPQGIFEQPIVPDNRAQLAISIEPYFPQQRRKFYVPDTPAVVNDPPFGQRLWLKTVLDAWRPPPPDFVYQTLLPQGAQVDDPPFDGRRLRMPTILETWRPPPPEPWNPILHITPPPSDDIIIWMWKRVF